MTRRSRGMRRAYRPRPATVDLIARLSELPGIARVHTIAPSHGSRPKPTMLRLVKEDALGIAIHTDMTLPEAREYLALNQKEA